MAPNLRADASVPAETSVPSVDRVTDPLTSPDLHVPPPPPGPDAERLARTARWSNGPEHARRRAAVEALLRPLDPDRARTAAARATAAALLGGGPGPCDVMPIARHVPLAVLAGLLAPGGAEAGAEGGAEGDAEDPGAEGDAEDPGAGLEDAVTGVLVQARDATAALVGCRLLGIADAPVRWTRRVAAGPTAADVRVDLPPGGAFGRGPHACPGRHLAPALADGVVAAVLAGRRPVPDQPVAFDPALPNLRLPVAVLVERR
jgi:hypothetical protein